MEAARENGPPKSISDIPLAWVKGQCEQVFTQGLLSDLAGPEARTSALRRYAAAYAKSCFRSCARRAARRHRPQRSVLQRPPRSCAITFCSSTVFFKLTLSQRNKAVVVDVQSTFVDFSRL